MEYITSRDGTRIAFDLVGTGPTLVLVGGALQHRAFDEDTAQLAALLAPHFRVIHYDRRGRGDSGDTSPYAVAREVEDLEALIEAGGGTAYVYGISSGAALALEAALKVGGQIKKLALYEVAYDSSPEARQAWRRYATELRALLSADRRGDAVQLFLTLLGTSADELQAFSHSPVWPLFEAVAPTLAYDALVLGEEAEVPLDKARQVTVPTLLLAGGAETPYRASMHATLAALREVMPDARTQILADQTHFVSAEALAPVLIEFFRR